jgi:hypothetical protein
VVEGVQIPSALRIGLGQLSRTQNGRKHKKKMNEHTFDLRELGSDTIERNHGFGSMVAASSL